MPRNTIEAELLASQLGSIVQSFSDQSPPLEILQGQNLLWIFKPLLNFCI